MKRLWPIPLVLFTIAFVILIQDGPTEKNQEATTDAQVVVEELSPELATEVTPLVEPVPDTLSRESTASKELEVFPILEFEGPAITIEVWDFQKKQPVPFARVLLAPITKGGVSYSGNDFRERLIQHGEIYRCDKNGQLRAPRSWVYRWAGAESDQLWGTARLLESEYRDTTRISVAPDRDFMVRVLDANGEPQPDITVRLIKAQYGTLYSLVEQQTNDLGIATLFNVGDPALRGNRADGFALIAGNPPPPQDITLQPRAEIPTANEIVLAPCGQLLLRLHDLSSNPVADSRKIKIRLVKPDQDPLRKSRNTVFTTTVESKGGTCLIPGIAAGFPIRIQIDFEGIGDWETFTASPLQADEFRVMGLSQQRAHPALSFRVVDLDGQPLANHKVNCLVKGDLQFQSRTVFQEEQLTTDAQGNGFLLLAQPQMEREEVMIHSRYLQISTVPKNDEDPISGRMDISREFPIREYDLGDYELGEITLKPKEILAQGQVVDVVGKAIVGARVHISQSASRNTDGISMEGYSLFLGNTATTDVNGHFVIYGEAAEGKAKVNARKTGYPGASTSWLGPTSPHTIVMDAGFVIQGEILLPEGLESKGVNVSFHLVGTDNKQYPKASDYGPQDGLFRIVGAPNEMGYLQIGSGSAWPFPVLATVENVMPWRPGEEGDPRLNPLDLREVLNTFKVNVVDNSGKLLSDITFLTVRRREGGTSTVGFGSADGKGFFASATDQYEVTIKAAGYRTLATILRQPETTITMQPSLEASFELAWMPELKNLRSVVLSLSATDGEGSTGLLEDSLFDENGILHTKVSRPGRFEVSLGIHVNYSSSSMSLENENGNPIIIEILDSENVQNYRFDPPQDFFDHWLKK